MSYPLFCYKLHHYLVLLLLLLLLLGVNADAGLQIYSRLASANSERSANKLSLHEVSPAFQYCV